MKPQLRLVVDLRPCLRPVILLNTTIGCQNCSTQNAATGTLFLNCRKKWIKRHVRRRPLVCLIARQEILTSGQVSHRNLMAWVAKYRQRTADQVESMDNAGMLLRIVMLLRSLPPSFDNYITLLENHSQEGLTMDLAVARLRNDCQKRDCQSRSKSKHEKAPRTKAEARGGINGSSLRRKMAKMIKNLRKNAGAFRKFHTTAGNKS